MSWSIWWNWNITDITVYSKLIDKYQEMDLVFPPTNV